MSYNIVYNNFDRSIDIRESDSSISNYETTLTKRIFTSRKEAIKYLKNKKSKDIPSNVYSAIYKFLQGEVENCLDSSSDSD